MTWSTLLCVPPPWPASTDVERKSIGHDKSVGHVSSADTLNSRLTLLNRYSYFIYF
jgi:hypothetical protein